MKHLAWLVLLGLVAACPAWSQKKNKRGEDEKDTTQKLEVLKDPPPSVAADTQRLAFHVTPPFSKGLLSAQVRDALKWLFRETRGAQIVKLRAFVAGTGDVRRVQTIVSEMFTEKRQALPALSVLQAGALPTDGSQVVFESISVEKKTVNPNGLAFISGQPASSDDPVGPVAPLAEQSIARLRAALNGAGLESKTVLRTTCFLSSLGDLEMVRKVVGTEFPAAVLNFVQVQRAPLRSVAACEAVARLESAYGQGWEFINPADLPPSGLHSQVALVNASRLAFTSAQLAFGYEAKDARLAFERLGRILQQAGTSYEQVVMTSVYPLSGGVADLVTKVRGEFYKGPKPPAGTMVPLEGLSSVDAAFGVDAVAVLPDSK